MTSTPRPVSGALSPAGVARWLEDNATSLSARRISAEFGRRLTRHGIEPVVWVSFTSAWAAGRLVRASDGSSEIEAHRFRDGAVVLAGRYPSTSTTQLDDVAQACADPGPGVVGHPPTDEVRQR